MLQDIRIKGLIKLVIGISGIVLVGFLKTQGFLLRSGGWIAFGLIGAIGVIGLLEVVLGIPFTQLAGNWDSLKGWQKGIITAFVVILCFGLLYLTMVILYYV